ncbi:MAG: mevalonate kinase [Candidatus ainarchaeum sp.]|nr:mevalonate kinase [Candidatus ainarchaeum sp.]
MASFAPGSVKLFGEHAVIYDRVGLSASFDRYANVKVSRPEGKSVEIVLPDLGLGRTLGEDEVKKGFEDADSVLASGGLRELEAMRQGNFALPFVYIVGSVFLRTGFMPLRVEVKSDVPKYSGLGSSSAIFAALACELNNFCRLRLSSDGIADLANKGDSVVHGKPSGIDANTCVRGGFIRFRRSEGVKPFEVKSQIQAVIANTLVKKNTGEMISRVAKAYAADQPRLDAIFDDVQEAAFAGMDAIRERDMVKLGAEFERAQSCFEKLGLSTRESDDIIRFAKKKGAYGAKITGAGGGGCVLILSEAQGRLSKLLNAAGYPSFETALGVHGAKHTELG